MSETDNDITAYDPAELCRRLAHVVQRATELQINVINWTIKDDADLKALLKDFGELQRAVDHARSEATSALDRRWHEHVERTR